MEVLQIGINLLALVGLYVVQGLRSLFSFLHVGPEMGPWMAAGFLLMAFACAVSGVILLHLDSVERAREKEELEKRLQVYRDPMGLDHQQD